MTSPRDTAIDQWIDKVMEQAQSFASAWALVGGRFDRGGMLEDANEAKAELRAMLAAPQAAPAGEFKWPEPPPRKGQSPVLFDDGYEEGWAKAVSTIKAMLAAAPTQAAQEPRADEPVWCGCGDGITPNSGAKCGTCVQVDSLAQEPRRPMTTTQKHDLFREALNKYGSDLIVFESYLSGIEDAEAFHGIGITGEPTA